MRGKLKTLLSLGAVLGCLMTVSGCTFSEHYSEEFTNKNVEAAEEYLKSKYPFAEEDITFSKFGISSSFSFVEMPYVRFTSEKTDDYITVWNPLGAPLDDYGTKYWSEDARKHIEELAYSIYGKDMQLQLLGTTTGVTETGEAPSTLEEFLSCKNSCPFVIAVYGASTAKEAMLTEFIEKLQAENISQYFTVCYYTDFKTLTEDLDAFNAVNGYGDFGNWITVFDYDDIPDWNESGTSYRAKSSTEKTSTVKSE